MELKIKFKKEPKRNLKGTLKKGTLKKGTQKEH